MTLDVVIPVTRGAILPALLRSFALGEEKPEFITLVTNHPGVDEAVSEILSWWDGFVAMGVSLPVVRVLRFETDYAWGQADQGLRRNVGIWSSEASHVMLFDDDQIAHATTVRAMKARLAESDFVLGHHRFVDYSALGSLLDLVKTPPERGRPRETRTAPSGETVANVNRFQMWQSAYAGLMGFRRDFVIDLGGFDLAYTRGGSEDQQLARRVAERHVVYEPPFAWHPESKLPADLRQPGTVCPDDAHELDDGSTLGAMVADCTAVRSCRKCPWIERLDQTVVTTEILARYDHGRVRAWYEEVG